MSQALTRVTIVTETFAPEINGVAHTLGQLVNGLRQAGIHVQVIRPRQGRQDLNRQEDNLDIITVPGLPLPGYSGLHFGLPLTGRIANALAQFQPQAMYVATEGPMGWAAVKAAHRHQVPVLSGFHTNFHQYIRHYRLGSLEKLAYRYLRYFHNRTNGTLVPTRIQRDELTQHGFHNVQVLARGVDSGTFSPQHRQITLRQQWGVEDTDLVLLYVGRIASEKNLDLALATYLRLQASDERIKMVLVGDGPELATIRSQHPEILCCGMKRGQELAQHYASGDIFLFPSKTDTFGNVVTEAMASGLAVISFDYAAAHEHITTGRNGMLAPFDEDDAFMQHAETLSDSPNLLKRIRQEARSHSEGISWDSIVEAFIQRLEGARNEGIPDDNCKDSTPLQ